MNAATFVEWAAAQSVQVTVVFAVMLALDTVAARFGCVRVRTALWAAFLVKLVLPPGVSSPLSVARLVPASLDGGIVSNAFVGAADVAALAPPGAAIAAWVWLAGCALCVSLAVQRMRRTHAEWLGGDHVAAPVDAATLLAVLARRIGLAHTPRLCVRDDAEGAAAVGLFAPVIVVPAKLVAGDPRALEHVLLHELAHVRRRDALRALLWTAARCAYWFHPLVHAAARRSALVREMACDELAAHATSGGARAYRSTLLDLARPLALPSPALTLYSAGPAQILARLEHLARPTSRVSRRADAAALAMFVLLCACCVPLGTAPSRADAPALDEVQGCMRKRYLVLAELAKSSRTSTDHH